MILETLRAGQMFTKGVDDGTVFIKVKEVFIRQRGGLEALPSSVKIVLEWFKVTPAGVLSDKEIMEVMYTHFLTDIQDGWKEYTE